MLEYTLGSNKGQSRQGDVINSPFALGTFRDGQPVPFDDKYTSARVDETNVSEANTTEFTMQWIPVIAGTIAVTTTIAGAVTQYIDDGKGSLYKMGADGVTAVSRVVNPDGSVTVNLTLAPAAQPAATIDYAEGKLTFSAAPGAGTVAVSYSYNNVVIPQNDLPIINVEMKSMPLIAKARRIAVYYSQIAA